MATIQNTNLNKPVEFWGHKNEDICSTPVNENAKFIMDSTTVKSFIDELTQLNQLSLIEASLQGLAVREDGTPLLTAFPTLEQFKAIIKKMNTIPQALKECIERWEALGANEMVIDFVEYQIESPKMHPDTLLSHVIEAKLLAPPHDDVHFQFHQIEWVSMGCEPNGVLINDYYPTNHQSTYGNAALVAYDSMVISS
ncbi:hypothetical protein [Vibrio alginolyticus]|uniref:hypothetical protein n=1 Tax=Vibrio alginolyticus TaxID=663 RepID=UPI00211A86B6|nr:hypothetical protein [Vibrio alginolyticus]MCQ9090988.1 hypothetical protein [Vibrio alginolyticus]